jgi:hypothetical protein
VPLGFSHAIGLASLQYLLLLHRFLIFVGDQSWKIRRHREAVNERFMLVHQFKRSITRSSITSMAESSSKFGSVVYGDDDAFDWLNRSFTRGFDLVQLSIPNGSITTMRMTLRHCSISWRGVS